MKVRNGFVSNSSSSSFCILGVEVDRDFFSNLNDGELDNYEWEEANRPYSAQPGLEGIDGYVIGFDPSTLDEDKTLRTIKTEMAADLSEKLNMPVRYEDIDFFSDGGYDG